MWSRWRIAKWKQYTQSWCVACNNISNCKYHKIDECICRASVHDHSKLRSFHISRVIVLTVLSFIHKLLCICTSKIPQMVCAEWSHMVYVYVHDTFDIISFSLSLYVRSSWMCKHSHYTLSTILRIKSYLSHLLHLVW